MSYYDPQGREVADPDPDDPYTHPATPPASETVEAAWEALDAHIQRLGWFAKDIIMEHRPSIRAAIRAEADERVRALRGRILKLPRSHAQELGSVVSLGEVLEVLALDGAPED